MPANVLRLCSPKRKRRRNKVYPVLIEPGNKKDDSPRLSRRDLAAIAQEAQMAEESRQDQEEDMWRHHEEHSLDLQHQQQLLAEQEVETAQLQRELQQLKQQLTDSINGRSPTKKARTRSESPMLTNQVAHQTESQAIVGAGMMGSAMGVESQIQEFANLYSDKISKDKPNGEGPKRKLNSKSMDRLHSQRELTPDELLRRKEEIEQMFLASSQKVEETKQRIKDKEKQYKMQDASHLETVSVQSDIVEKLQHRQKQLMLYIDEKEKESLPDSERVEPIGESCSEESLSNVSGKAFNRHKPSMKHLPHSRSASEPGKSSPLLSPHGQSHLVAAQVHEPERVRSASPRAKSPKGGDKKPRRPSQIAEAVTARLYNAEKIRKHAEAHGGARRKTHASISPSRDQPALGSRSKSSPVLEDLATYRPGVTPMKALPSALRSPTSPTGGGLLPGSPRLRSSNSSLASVPEYADKFQDSGHSLPTSSDSRDSDLSASCPEGSITMPKGQVKKSDSYESALNHDRIEPVLTHSQLTAAPVSLEQNPLLPKSQESELPMVIDEPIAIEKREDGSGDDGTIKRASPDGDIKMETDAPCSRQALDSVPQVAKHIPDDISDATFQKSGNSKKPSKKLSKDSKDSKSKKGKSKTGKDKSRDTQNKNESGKDPKSTSGRDSLKSPRSKSEKDKDTKSEKPGDKDSKSKTTKEDEKSPRSKSRQGSGKDPKDKSIKDNKNKIKQRSLDIESKDDKIPEIPRRRSVQDIQSSPISPRGRGLTRSSPKPDRKEIKRPGSGPAALGQRLSKSPRSERSSSKESLGSPASRSDRSMSRDSTGSKLSDRSKSRESFRSERSTSKDSVSSSRLASRRTSTDSVSSLRSEKSVGKESVSSGISDDRTSSSSLQRSKFRKKKKVPTATLR